MKALLLNISGHLHSSSSESQVDFSLICYKWGLGLQLGQVAGTKPPSSSQI